MIYVLILALFAAANAQRNDGVQMVCQDTSVIQNAFYYFGTGFTECISQPLDHFLGWNCKLSGYPQVQYLQLQLREGNRQFAKTVVVKTEIDGYTQHNSYTNCATCNRTEYASFDPSKCNADTYFKTDDLTQDQICLADEFPSKSSDIVTDTYYYKLPLTTANVQVGNTFTVSLNVADNLVCKTFIRLLPPTH